MIKTILIDDEPKAIKLLKSLLEEIFPNIDIIDTCTSPDDAFISIIKNRPELIFLDIAMPKQSGFDLLKRLPNLNFEIIFVTAFDEYALEAVKFSAIGYVVKPINDEELIAAVKNAEQRISEKQESERNKQLLATILNPGNAQNRIGIPTSSGIEFIPTIQILRCEGVDGCTKVIVTDRKNIISSYNVGEFKKMLEDYGFYAVHKSHLINTAHISSYDREGFLKMANGDIIPVARRKRAEFLEKVKRF